MVKWEFFWFVVQIGKSDKGSFSRKINKVIGTRGQGVGEGCPRELTTEHLTKASLRLDKPLCNSLGLRPMPYLSSENRAQISLKKS